MRLFLFLGETEKNNNRKPLVLKNKAEGENEYIQKI